MVTLVADVVTGSCWECWWPCLWHWPTMCSCHSASDTLCWVYILYTRNNDKSLHWCKTNNSCILSVLIHI